MMNNEEVKELLEDMNKVLAIQEKYSSLFSRDAKKTFNEYEIMRDKCVFSGLLDIEFERFVFKERRVSIEGYPFVSLHSPHTPKLFPNDVRKQVSLISFYNAYDWNVWIDHEKITLYDYTVFKAQYHHRLYEIVKPFLLEEPRKKYTENMDEEALSKFLETSFKISFEGFKQVKDEVFALAEEYLRESKQYYYRSPVF